KIKGVVDVVNQTIVIGPAVNFRVDLQKAERAGFAVRDVAALQTAILDGELASQMIRGDRLIGICVRYAAEYRSSIEKLKSLQLTSQPVVTLPPSIISVAALDCGLHVLRPPRYLCCHASLRFCGSAGTLSDTLNAQYLLIYGCYYGGGHRAQERHSDAGCGKILQRPPLPAPGSHSSGWSSPASPYFDD